MATPWDQRPEEPDDAYARFLLYRGLGPGRSLDAAYNLYVRTFRNAAAEPAGNKRQRLPVPGFWGADSARWGWVDRAAAWDVHVLTTFGERMACRFVGALDAIAEKVAVAAADPRLKPREWRDVIQAVQVLTGYVTPDVAQAVKPDSKSDPAGKPERKSVK